MPEPPLLGANPVAPPGEVSPRPRAGTVLVMRVVQVPAMRGKREHAPTQRQRPELFAFWPRGKLPYKEQDYHIYVSL